MRDEMSGEYYPASEQSDSERVQSFIGDDEIGDEEIYLSGDDAFGAEEIATGLVTDLSRRSGDDEADLQDHLVSMFGEDLGIVGDEEIERAIIGWSLLKGLKSVVKAVVKSPLVKAAATGAAFVCPAVGVPAVAAITMADKVVSAAKSANPKQRIAAKQMIKSTATLAKRGDANAQRGLSLLVNQAQKNKMLPRLRQGYRRVSFVVDPRGRIQRE